MASLDMAVENIPIPSPLTEDQIANARVTVCANAFDSIEAEQLLRMLGLL